MKKTLSIIFILLIASESKSQVMLKDVLPNANACNSCGSHPMNFTRVGNYVYFIADDGTYGFELWKTDGTEGGTMMVKDINTIGDGCGSGSGLWSPNATGIYAIGNNMVFFADDAIHGYEPWVSDGTESGTQILLDINGSSTSSLGLSMGDYYFKKNVIQIGDKVLFNARNANLETNVWVTDGTTSGTHILKDQNGDPLPQFWDAVIADSSVYFVIGQIFKSDGTSAGTQLYSPNFYNGHRDDKDW